MTAPTLDLPLWVGDVDITPASYAVTHGPHELGRAIRVTAHTVTPIWDPQCGWATCTLPAERTRDAAIAAIVKHAMAAHSEAMGL